MFSTKKVNFRLLYVFLLLVLSITIVYAAEPPWAAPKQTEKKYTTERVNLRQGPSTEKDCLQVLSRGESVEFLSIYNNEWSAVIFNEKKGFIKSEFLSNEKPPDPKAELLTWSEVKPMLKIGVTVEVLDIRSGLRYNVKSFSNGNHADIEPVTTEDTAIMKRTFNDHWSWDGRPVWVTINGRTIAAAINGMPHGGGVNDNNGMDGQVCLHFKGSTVHNGNISYANQLQAVVMESYNAAQ